MATLLEEIKSPQDLKKLNIQELALLSEEIREKIINTIAVTGGHLAPNLGVVELTIALHRIFNTPEDKIIWDVGHQCYIHKLLTGRINEFETIRQFGGISGFPKRAESRHDAFDTGHSSTSISSALGMAIARDLKGEKNSVVAVIGDGALTGGMAFEALNHAGHLGTNLIVVLNHNEMSIAENIGGLAEYLSRMRTDPKYHKGKDELESIVTKIPGIGKSVIKALERVKDSFKYLVVPGMLFEELGFTYLGPIDGHNILAMQSVLQHAKNTEGPVLVHVVTKKGRGYLPAENNPDKFHGIGSFDIATGDVVNKSEKPTYTKIFGNTLVNIAKENEKVVAITAAMPSGTGLSNFATEFPSRFIDVGIAEQHAVTMAAGMATQGFKPVFAVYSTFLQRSYDQVLHDVCLQRLPVVFAIDRAGLVGDDGPTHHGVFDFAYLRHIPNMVVMAPKDENELQHMLKTAIDYDGPISIRYPRGNGLGVTLDKELKNINIGKAEVLREGNDIAVFAVGSMVKPAIDAADKLKTKGIKVSVINGRFIKPLDEKCIVDYAKSNKLIITIEEHSLNSGFGSGILELLEERNIATKVHRMGIPDEFIEHGNTNKLLEKYNLTANGIIEVILKELKATNLLDINNEIVVK